MPTLSAPPRTELQEALDALPAQIAALFAPQPWPSAEILALARAIATETGIAERCGQKACRRAGKCRAKTIGETGPACGTLWPDEEIARLEAQIVGLVFSYVLTERRNFEIRSMLTSHQNAGKAGGKYPR
ncbi:hypothetical protein EET67_15320 [Pseudaminobacter arsenicus]|uniref:Uncharacterized protein n=1 Tax=Borborobacter arsenicus TaxID=1851146 RepID=A0A432V413_9HYPH|nr:hypothetical protein [Pseudaminobacter arsenicus]RUM96906.1 hypothetical protein EET67_15320 [Pseudaminobacter arsenicus]